MKNNKWHAQDDHNDRRMVRGVEGYMDQKYISWMISKSISVHPGVARVCVLCLWLNTFWTEDLLFHLWFKTPTVSVFCS